MVSIPMRLFAIIVVLALVVCACADATSPTQDTGTVSPTTTIPTATKAVPTMTTLTKASQPPVTHGTPHLRGPLSDFFGKYGKAIGVNPATDPFWSLDQNGDLTLGARDMTGQGVEYIAITTPDTWSQQRVLNYCLMFAPPDYVALPQPAGITGLVTYDSPSGKFAVHFQTGSCYLNTL